MCRLKRAGSEELGCQLTTRAYDFCGGLGIAGVAVATRYRKGQELRNIPVKKLSVTQQQLARILRILGIWGGEQVNAIEHGRVDIPKQFERELREFAKEL
jgi:hypothetical protein